MSADFYDFIEFVRDEFKKEDLEAIVEFEFSNSGVEEFQYYHNVTQFWDDNREWVEECLEDWAFE